jgi:hypothetical protein
MQSSLRNTFWRPLPRRLSAGAALLSYLAATLGLPLPALSRKKEKNQPFPCQNNPCGCQTAEQCWQHCCCYTPEEHWAWARANHVTPPPYAVKPAGHGWRTVRLRDQAKAKSHALCSRCQRQEASKKARRWVKASKTSREGEKSCCRAASARRRLGSTSNGPAKKSAPPRSAGFRWAFGWTALQCHGVSTLWLITGAALPARPPRSWNLYLTLAGWLSDRDVGSCVLPFPPPLPPPRLLMA